MSFPACFETQAQYDEWNRAADAVYHYGGRTRPSFCCDCTPDYKSRMVQEERCEHPTVRFYRFGNAYMGIQNMGQSGRIDALKGEEWELVNEPDTEIVSVDA